MGAINNNITTPNKGVRTKERTTQLYALVNPTFGVFIFSRL